MKITKGRWNVKRALSVLLACTMLFSSVELPVFAAEPDADAVETVAETGEDTGMMDGDEERGKPDGTGGLDQMDSPDADDEEEQPDASDEKEQPEISGTEEAEDQPEAPGTEDGDEQPENPEDSEEDDSVGENGDDSDAEESSAEEETGKAKEKSVSVLSDEQTVNDSNLQVVSHTQDEIRAYLAQSGAAKDDPVSYAAEPVTSAPYSAGALSAETQQSAIDMLNQIRYIAGLSYDVTFDEAYASMSQAASLVNYVNGKLSHTPEQPSDMEKELYQLGYSGAGKSNIAWASWASRTLNETLVDSWMEDGDDSNISRMGHRRWILNPSMGKTGFGAVKGSKGIYSAVYAFDRSGSSKNIFGVAWPAQNMPTSYFSTKHPWSVSLGETVTASEIQVKLTRTDDGKVWSFSSESADGYFNVNNDGYGETGCIIFRPSNITSYDAGDVYRVEITKNDEPYVNYSVNFFDAAIEGEDPENPDNSETISLSGITMEDKVYDGEAAAYTGMPVLWDVSGNAVTGISVEASYTGELADGSIYEKSTAAPVQAGSYTLLFEVAEADADKYMLKDASYSFEISQREATITAESVEVAINGQLPEESELKYTVEGLLEGDELITKPSMKYSESSISTAVAGTYEIIPYGADAGNNYSVAYVNGMLKIEEEKILYSGTVNQISWKVDSSGKLTIEGTGDWHEHKEEYGVNGHGWNAVMPWTERQENILSAEVRVTGVTCLADMFKDCRNLASVDLSALDTGKVTNMESMFEGCGSLKSLDLSGFNTSKVTNMESMFEGCGSLKSLDLSNFNTSQVTSMYHMFDGCSSLESLDVSSFDTGKVMDMSGMFRGCSSLTSLDVSRFNTANVEYMSIENGSINLECDGMFYGCSGLEELDVSSFDTSKVKNMRGMFYECSSLKSLDVSRFDASNAVNLQGMFWGCSSLESLDVSSFGCPGAGTGSYRVSLSGMFAECSSLKSLNMENFHTNNVDDMGEMFSRCSSLTSLDVSSFDTSQVNCMSLMFNGCSSLTSLDVSGFDTSQVTDMNNMFALCSSLTSLDVSNFDTSQVTNMAIMFDRCSSLTSLDVSSFDTSQVHSMLLMFSGCSSLTSLDLSNFDMSNVYSQLGALFGSDLDRLVYIRSPRNCPDRVELPGSRWYSGLNDWIDVLPAGSPESIDLYKNGYPGDGQTKQFTYISGINVKSKVYDKKTEEYLGTPVVTDSVGNPITDVTLDWSYSGQLADGTPYTDVSQAPVQAGSYILTFTMTGTDAEQYILHKTEYPFTIHRKEVAVTVPARVIELDEELPDLSTFSDYTVTGLLEGDDLIRKPSFRYNAEHISTGKAGTYWIIPYGADAGNNYKFKYVDGEIKVGSLSSISLATAEITIQDIIYDGRDHYPEPVVRYRDRILERNVDYRVEYNPSPVNRIGEYTVLVHGEGCYYGTVTAKFRVINDETYGDILPSDIPDGQIPEGLWIAGISEEGYYYTGKAIKPAVRVYDYKTLLKEKSDYTISYTKNVNVNKVSAAGSSGNDASAGNALPTIIVTGKGNYSGKATKYFDILPCDLTEVAEADDMAVAYTGKVQKPAPELILNGKKLKKNTDYTIAYHDVNSDNYDERLDSVKEKGEYAIEFIGRGNFTGFGWCSLVITDNLKLMSKASVAKIPNQSYNNGSECTPEVTVKDGKTTLEKGVHYNVEYRNNTGVGTAYAIIKGIEEAGYSGTKRVAFKIAGTPIKKAKVTFGTEFLPYEYNGTEIEAELWLTVMKKYNGVETTEYLEKDKDYTLEWQKNENAGTASVIITGIGGYTGTVKKSFKIKKYDIAANADGQFKAVLENSQTLVPYAKGGIKAKPVVTFEAGDGNERILTEGKDYTLSYRRHTGVTGEGTGDLAEITVKGKGNFSGTYRNKLYYEIVHQDIGSLTLTAQDKIYQNKKNIYATKVVITDLNGNNLKAGVDYDKTFTYTYKDQTTVNNAVSGGTTVRTSGDIVDKEDIIPEGTVLQVQANAKAGSNYTGTIIGEYRITRASIASASVTIAQQPYTGTAVTLDKSQITVKIKGMKLEDSDYEIVEDSYKNNVKKGTASVTIKGVGNYGGTKTVKFTIKAKGFSWWR